MRPKRLKRRVHQQHMVSKNIPKRAFFMEATVLLTQPKNTKTCIFYGSNSAIRGFKKNRCFEGPKAQRAVCSVVNFYSIMQISYSIFKL